MQIPLLNETRCTGCGLCVTICPVDCLEQAGPLPWLPRPAACISCGLCALLCPDQAIVMGDSESV